MEIASRFPLSLTTTTGSKVLTRFASRLLMAEQVKPAHSDPAGVYGLQFETARVMRRERARIPSWLGADAALHSEAAYIGADRFRYQTIPLAIRRRTIHLPHYYGQQQQLEAQVRGIALRMRAAI